MTSPIEPQGDEVVAAVKAVGRKFGPSSILIALLGGGAASFGGIQVKDMMAGPELRTSLAACLVREEKQAEGYRAAIVADIERFDGERQRWESDRAWLLSERDRLMSELGIDGDPATRRRNR